MFLIIDVKHAIELVSILLQFILIPYFIYAINLHTKVKTIETKVEKTEKETSDLYDWNKQIEKKLLLMEKTSIEELHKINLALQEIKMTMQNNLENVLQKLERN